MAIIKKPVAGGSTDVVRSARTWSSISDVVNAHEAGEFRPRKPDHSLSRFVLGIAHEAISAGDVVSIDPAFEIGEFSTKTPHVKLKSPSWHDDSSRLLFAETAALERGVAIRLVTSGWAVCNLDKKVEQTDQKDKQYVMMSPDEEAAGKMRAAASGLYRILSYVEGGEKALVDLNSSQPFWRYELLSDGFRGSDKEGIVKLIDINDEVFTDEATIEEKYATVTDTDGYMENQARGDKGMCFLAGGKFHAIQAAC